MATSSTRRSGAPPATAKNLAMSKRHLRESVQFNKKHADEHAKAMKEDLKSLKKINKAKAKNLKSGTRSGS